MCVMNPDDLLACGGTVHSDRPCQDAGLIAVKALNPAALLMHVKWALERIVLARAPQQEINDGGGVSFGCSFVRYLIMELQAA